MLYMMLADSHILLVRVGHEPMGLLYFLIIGLIAGWLAGKITKGRGFGILRNLVIGVIGAMLGGFVFSLIGLSATGTLGSIVTATVGALLLLYIINAVVRR